MFLASVLALCGGIYLEALYRAPVKPLFLAAALAAAAIPLFRRKGRAAAALTLIAFTLCGASRLALLEAGRAVPDPEKEEGFYEGLVVESSTHVKVLSLSKPASIKGLRVVFLTGADLDVSQVVSISGRMRAIVPSFRNPGCASWKRLKLVEGIAYELRGTVLSAAEGADPVSRMRRYFKGNIERSGAAQADILKALTIGDRVSISREKNDLFLRTGTSHILAVSGFNVGIISGFFFFLARTAFGRIKRFRLSGRHRRYAALLTIPFPFVFMLVAGAGVSVIRATIMVAVFMLALFLERERDFYNTMALAALVILLLYPYSLLTPSFQLTFISLLFIVISMERLLPLIRRIKSAPIRWSAATVLSTVAATAGTAPIVLYYFYGMNLLCLVHNLATIPLMGVVATTLGLVGMTHPWGQPLLLIAGQVTQANLVLLHVLDFGYLYPLVRPTLSEAGLYYALIVTLLCLGRSRAARLLLALLIPLCLAQVYADYRQRFNDDLVVHFIDVGMGNAALIEAPGGMRILIDGGGYRHSDFDTGRQVIAPFLLYRKVRTLDYVINTHPHTDHLAGLLHILRHFNVSHLVTAGLYPTEPAFRELMEAARSRGVTHLIWKKGDGMSTGDFRMTALHPAVAGPRDDPNETSLVFRLEHRHCSFLLPADIGAATEEGLVLSGVRLRSDVLELSHHGSAFSNSFAFIYAVRPTVAVLSVAGGYIKHLPGEKALERFDALSIPVLRTDRDGLVECRSDGKTVGCMARGDR